MNNEKIFKEVVAKILDMGARGVKPWTQSWDDAKSNYRQEFQTSFEKLPVADHIIRSTGAYINHNGQGCPGYNWALDEIRIPHLSKFKNQTSYYATMFHELSHWTGGLGRLERPTLLNCKSNQSSNYSLEEMTAEFSSAMILGTLGLDNIENSTAYMSGFFMEGLGGSPRALEHSVKHAAEAANYILEKAL